MCPRLQQGGNMSKIILSLFVCLILAACANAGKISRVQMAMSKPEVIDIMGTPVSTSASGKIEYLNYSLLEATGPGNWPRPYYVRLIDGKVDSYGRLGDFDSTKTNTLRIENDQNIKQSVQVNSSQDLYTELKKLKELKDSGVISEEEFQTQKKKQLETH